MKREWEPGDVAMVNERTCIRTTRGEWEHGDARAFRYVDEQALDIRPLVVIDPDDDDQVLRLWGALPVADTGITPGDVMAALHEFANPTPPKPEEPSGLGAVVEDDGGGRWVRVDALGHQDHPRVWVRELDDAVSPWLWTDFTAVKVLSAGWSE